MKSLSQRLNESLRINEEKTFNTKQLLHIAKLAGEIVIDAEDSIKDLAVAYGDKTPKSRLMQVLQNYDIEPTDVLESLNEAASTPASLVGKKGEDYNGTKGKIIAAEYVKNWKKLSKYDNSGWLDKDGINDLGLDDDDILVAFDSKNGTDVFAYGDGGVELLESVNEATGQSKTELEDAIKTMQDKIKWIKSKRQNSIHPFDPQQKMSDYLEMYQGWLKSTQEKLDALNESLNEAKVSSKADFAKYAKEVLQKAHGDDYDQKIVDKLVDDLAKEHGDDWGAAVGALTSGLGEEFEDENIHENSTLNESKMSPEQEIEILAKIQNALPELEKMIKKEGKFDVKLSVALDGGSGITITSSDLVGTFKGTAAYTMFKTFIFACWFPTEVSTDGNIGGIPKYSYTHPTGGSNGTQAIWSGLWFNVESGKWLTRK